VTTRCGSRSVGLPNRSNLIRLSDLLDKDYHHDAVEHGACFARKISSSTPIPPACGVMGLERNRSVGTMAVFEKSLSNLASDLYRV
jgi:hypothetical protein